MIVVPGHGQPRGLELIDFTEKMLEKFIAKPGGVAVHVSRGRHNSRHHLDRGFLRQ